MGAEKLELHVRYLSCLLSWQGDLITRGCVKLLPGWDKLVVQVAAGQENTSPGGMMEPRLPPWPAPRHGHSMVLWPFHPSGVYLAQRALLYFPGLENTQG